MTELSRQELRRVPPRDRSRRWEDGDTDRAGYIVLLVEPRRIRCQVFDPGKRPRRRTAGHSRRTRRNRVAQAQFKARIRRLVSDAELSEIAETMRGMATNGELQEPTPGLFCAIPEHDQSFSATRRRFVVIQRAWAQGCDSNEIAALLGTTKGTVAQNINRMRKRGWTLDFRRHASDETWRIWRAPKPANRRNPREPQATSGGQG